MDQCIVATLPQWRTSRKHATLNHSHLRMCRVLVYEISVSYRQLSQTRRLPSRPNKTPPNGLPKATDTPAAAAAANSFLFCAIKELKVNSFNPKRLLLTFIMSKSFEEPRQQICHTTRNMHQRSLQIVSITR